MTVHIYISAILFSICLSVSMSINDPHLNYKLIQKWTHKTQYKKKEVAEIRLSELIVYDKTDESDLSSSDGTKYIISVEFMQRKCPSNYINETFSKGSSGSYISDLVREFNIGSDELFAQIEGVSLQTLVFKCDDLCGKYSVSFFVPVTGQHRLRVFRTRASYTAVIEHDPAIYPPMFYEIFVDELLNKPLQKNSNLCPKDAFMDGFWSTDLNPFSKDPIKIESIVDAEDRGLPIVTNIEISKYMVNNKCAREINRFKWYNSLCDIEESPEDSFITPQRASEILTKKSIIFVGDSHVRGLADSFLDFSCNIKKGVYKKGNTNMQFHVVKENAPGEKAPQCAGLTVAYLSLTRCDSEISDRISGFMYAVINCGHHPASKLHYSYSRYNQITRELLDAMHEESVKPNRPYLFWLDMTAQPLRQDKYVITKQDWRTYHRLIIFREIVLKEILGKAVNSKHPGEVKMDFVPAFASTLSMFDKMCDNAHYPNDAKIPQVQQLLHKISIHDFQEPLSTNISSDTFFQESVENI